MERREFLQLLGLGIGMLSVPAAANAFTLAAPLVPTEPSPVPAPEPSVLKPEDMERAHVEKAYYGHWRRVNRRHNRRVSRRVYRRHSY